MRIRSFYPTVSKNAEIIEKVIIYRDTPWERLREEKNQNAILYEKEYFVGRRQNQKHQHLAEKLLGFINFCKVDSWITKF